MSTRTDAINAARSWLLQLKLDVDGQDAYRQIGIALVDCAIQGALLPPPEKSVAYLPDVTMLVTMDRLELIKLSRSYVRNADGIATDIDLVLAQLSISFARTDDLQAVAALLRLSALVDMDESLTMDAWNYVFDQQQPDGSFGLVSAELMSLGRRDDNVMPRLMMTVEVLWALAAYGLIGSKNVV